MFSGAPQDECGCEVCSESDGGTFESGILYDPGDR